MTRPPSGDAIRCERVVKRYGHHAALDGLDLAVGRGGVVGYLGPNGAGKSTTIRLLLDLARADSGAIAVLGCDPRLAGPELRRRIGYLPGELRLDQRLTVTEQLGYWAALRGDGAVDREYVVELCERLALDTRRRCSELSSGNRRKVGLVGALMARPELLVLDEPTSGIDPLAQAEFGALIKEARAEGRTVFLSSHVLSEVQRLADQVVILRAGRVVATGSVDELRRHAVHPFAVTFTESVPEDALRAIASVTDLEVHGREVRGAVTGDPNPFIGLLAHHRVEHLLMPEPDLDEAFLSYYADGARAEAAA